MSISKQFQQGQILLVVILVMVVALTVGLSVVTRTITNVRTSQEEEASQQAFSAAEAGIEKIIATNQTTPQNYSFSNNLSYSANVRNVGGTSFLVNNGIDIPKDDGIDIWLTSNPNNPSNFGTPYTGNVTVYWSKGSDICSASPDTNTKAALEIVLLTGTTASNAVASHIVLDPCSARASNNNFSTASIATGGSIGGESFGHNYTITGITNGLVMRVIPVYATTKMGVVGSASLPTQGQIIESTGTAGETKRKIVVYKGYPKVPVEFFPFLLFSP